MAANASKTYEIQRVKGTVRKGKLTVKSSIALPDGEVEVTVAQDKTATAPKNGLSYEELIAHPAFGILKGKSNKSPRQQAREIRARMNKGFSGERLRDRFNGVD